MGKKMFSRSAVSYALGIALFASMLVGGFAQSITDGVYSTAQATRGRQIYQRECADCHGGGMEGGSGPPLVGDPFLASWSARPVSGLVDKIQKTMPFSQPGTLSRVQSLDLTAYILQSGKFPAGSADLSDGTSARVTLPVMRTSSTLAPEGNLAELMRAIAFPNANIIFNVQVKDPGAQPKKQPAAAPFDYVEWGSTVYPGWLSVDQAAVALIETAPLLLTAGRRCQNGRIAPTDRADWKQYVADLIDVGKQARRASQARNFEAFIDISEKLNDACANCHKVYRDKGGTEGSGATRCQVASQEK